MLLVVKSSLQLTGSPLYLNRKAANIRPSKIFNYINCLLPLNDFSCLKVSKYPYQKVTNSTASNTRQFHYKEKLSAKSHDHLEFQQKDTQNANHSTKKPHEEMIHWNLPPASSSIVHICTTAPPLFRPLIPKKEEPSESRMQQVNLEEIEPAKRAFVRMLGINPVTVSVASRLFHEYSHFSDEDRKPWATTIFFKTRAHQSLPRTESIFMDLVKFQICTPAVISDMVSIYADLDLTSHAEQVIEIAQHFGIQVPVYACTAMLRMYGRQRNRLGVWKYFDKIEFFNHYYARNHIVEMFDALPLVDSQADFHILYLLNGCVKQLSYRRTHEEFYKWKMSDSSLPPPDLPPLPDSKFPRLHLDLFLAAIKNITKKPSLKQLWDIVRTANFACMTLRIAYVKALAKVDGQYALAELKFVLNHAILPENPVELFEPIYNFAIDNKDKLLLMDALSCKFRKFGPLSQDDLIAFSLYFASHHSFNLLQKSLYDPENFLKIQTYMMEPTSKIEFHFAAPAGGSVYGFHINRFLQKFDFNAATTLAKAFHDKGGTNKDSTLHPIAFFLMDCWRASIGLSSGVDSSQFWKLPSQDPAWFESQFIQYHTIIMKYVRNVEYVSVVASMHPQEEIAASCISEMLKARPSFAPGLFGVLVKFQIPYPRAKTLMNILAAQSEGTFKPIPPSILHLIHWASASSSTLHYAFDEILNLLKVVQQDRHGQTDIRLDYLCRIAEMVCIPYGVVPPSYDKWLTMNRRPCPLVTLEHFVTFLMDKKSAILKEALNNQSKSEDSPSISLDFPMQQTNCSHQFSKRGVNVNDDAARKADQVANTEHK